jgi:hypothetical protein
VSPSSPVVLAHGQISQRDHLSVELIRPADMPPVVRIVWPTAPTITKPARYNEVASTAMKVLAEASTTLARVKASRWL